MTTPVEECIRRDSYRKHPIGERDIKYLQKRRYQPPSLNEGWDDIYFI